MRRANITFKKYFQRHLKYFYFNFIYFYLIVLGKRLNKYHKFFWLNLPTPSVSVQVNPRWMADLLAFQCEREKILQKLKIKNKKINKMGSFTESSFSAFVTGTLDFIFQKKFIWFFAFFTISGSKTPIH